MSWRCGLCGLDRDRWLLRCPVDDTLQFPVADRPAAAVAPDAPARLEPARRGESVLIGPAVADLEPERGRSPFRPARCAALIAAAWLGAPLVWALFQPPSALREIGLFLLLTLVPLIGVYLFLLRFLPAAPGIVPALATVLEGVAGWILGIFPIRDRILTGRITVQPPLSPAVEVRLRGIRGDGTGRWPPPAAPATLRILGTWTAEPEIFEARSIEVLAPDGAGRLGDPIRSDRPRGWIRAGAILGGAAVLLAGWARVVLGAGLG